MKPENILQSDLLDILFDNRNKAYGAYALRRDYNNQLTKALVVTTALVLALALAYYIQHTYFKNESTGIAGAPVIEVDLKQIAEPAQTKKEEPKPKQHEPSKPKAQIIYTKPVIVENNLVDKAPTQISDLDNKQIGTIDKAGDDVKTGELITPPSDGVKNGTGSAPAAAVEPEAVTAPLNFAEVMPQFPGGMEAFKKFMLRNLRQPDDLEQGIKIVVKIRFVVDADGTIKNINLIQSGGVLDKEVLRVVNKMPQWKPGVQNGRNVPVYFTLPVTFVGPES